MIREKMKVKGSLAQDIKTTQLKMVWTRKQDDGRQITEEDL